jgi:hypothetical protein
MTSVADRKYAEALACEIAAVLTAAPAAARHSAAVCTRYDAAAGTFAVRVRLGRRFYDLVMPAPGAYYGLFRGHTWIGGMGLTSNADPVDVAARFLDRIEQTLGKAA